MPRELFGGGLVQKMYNNLAQEKKKHSSMNRRISYITKHSGQPFRVIIRKKELYLYKLVNHPIQLRKLTMFTMEEIYGVILYNLKRPDQPYIVTNKFRIKCSRFTPKFLLEIIEWAKSNANSKQLINLKNVMAIYEVKNTWANQESVEIYPQEEGAVPRRRARFNAVGNVEFNMLPQAGYIVGINEDQPLEF